jgi:hypothetical protein
MDISFFAIIMSGVEGHKKDAAAPKESLGQSLTQPKSMVNQSK